MKLIINEVEYNVDLTKHETTQDEQLGVFLGELEELKEAYNMVFCRVYPSGDGEILKENISQECIDSIKSLSKWLRYNSESEIKILSFKYNSYSEVFNTIHNLSEDFGEDSCYLHGQSLLQALVNFIYLFCKENNLNLTEQFKINNDKTNNRGTKKKVYLSDEEIADMVEITWRLGNSGYPQWKNKLQNIIDKIEG